MATDLDPIHLWSDMVGMVDHPMRQPQQALFDDLQLGGINVHGGLRVQAALRAG